VRLLVLLLLLVPGLAHADPVSIITGLSYLAGLLTSVTVLKGILLVGLYVYGTAKARRDKRKARAKGIADYNASLQDRNITAVGALPPWRIIVGRAITGGDVHAIFTSDKTGRREDGSSYTKPDGLKHVVIVFADHQCKAIHELFIDGAPFGALDGSGFVTSGEFFFSRQDSRYATIGGGGTVSVPETVVSILNAYTQNSSEAYDITTVTGSVTGVGTTTLSGPAGAIVNYVVQTNIPTVRVQKHLGTSSQTVDTYLNSVAPSEWVSTDRLLNKTYIVLTLDLENPRFLGGIPGVTADISGRLVYDPRKDSTVSGGSGSHRSNNTATWEWSDNSALAVRDYLPGEWGYQAAQSDLNDAYTITAANACDFRESASVQSHSQAFTVDASTEEIIFANDEYYGVGDGVRLTTTNTLPGGLATATTYYIIRGDQIASKRYKLATSVANAYAGTAINITSSGTGTHTCTFFDYARYKANGVFLVEDGRREAVLEDLCQSMAGFSAYGAQWEIVAGAWTSTVMDITDNDLVGQIEIVQSDLPIEQLLNGVRGTYIPIGKSVAQEFDNYQNSTFVSDDGAEYWTDLPLEFVDSKVRARNLCRILVETERNGQIIRYPAKLKAWQLQRGDRVRVTSTEYGFSLKNFRVTDWQFGLTSPVVLTLQEDDSTAWDIADAATSDSTPNTNLANPNIVQTITLGTISSGSGVGIYAADGTWIPRIKVTWTAVTDAYLTDGNGRIVILWRTPRSNNEWFRSEVSSDQTSAFIDNVREGEPVVIEVLARNSLGRTGAPSFTVHTVSVTSNSVVGDSNLIPNSSFEVDTNGDGLADGATAYSLGTTGTIVYSRINSGAIHGSWKQRLSGSGLGTGATDRVGMIYVAQVVAGLPYVLSVYAGNPTGSPKLRLRIDWLDSGASVISTDQTGAISVGGSLVRSKLTATAPTGAVNAAVYVFMESNASGPGLATVDLDALQLQAGSVLTPYAPRADELLAGLVGDSNLIPNSSFEVDANADGLADSATAYSAGTTGTVVYSRIGSGAVDGTYKQRFSGAGLGTSTSDRVGVAYSVPVLAGLTYTLSAYAGNPTGSPKLRLRIDWLNSGASVISTDQSGQIVLTSSMLRNHITATAPSGAVTAAIYIFMEANGAGPGLATVDVDAVQFQCGAILTPYAPRADELLAGVIATTHLQDDSVNTPKLDANARGVRRVVTPGSAVTITNVQHVPDGFGFNTVIVADSQFTAAYNGKAVVSFDGVLSQSASAGSTEFSLQNTDGTYDGWNIMESGTNPLASSRLISINSTRTFTLVAGNNYTFKCIGNKFNSGETVSVDRMQLVVEITYGA
jgi:hypothetical protein